MKLSIVIAILTGLAVSFSGCKQKSSTEQVAEESAPAPTEAAGDLKEAAAEAGQAIQSTAEKAAEEIKQGAEAVEKAVTNTAAKVNVGIDKVGTRNNPTTTE